MPVIHYYREHDALSRSDGEQEIEDVTHALIAAIEAQAAPARLAPPLQMKAMLERRAGDQQGAGQRAVPLAV